VTQWIVTLDTGRLGDWVVVEASTEEEARKSLTRSQRRKAQGIRRFVPSSEHRAACEADGVPYPRPTGRRRRRV